MNARRVVTPQRVVVAWVAGAIAGGVLAAFAVSFPAQLPRADVGFQFTLAVNLIIPASVGCGVGLLLAAPFWWLLHRLGYRQWWVAAALGAGLSVAAVFASGLITNGGKLPGPPPWYGLGVIATISALDGVLVWRIAYRRPRSENPELAAEVFR